MNQTDRLELDAAVRRAMQQSQNFQPQPQQGLPINAVVAMVQVGILSPRQAFHAIFHGTDLNNASFEGIELIQERPDGKAITFDGRV
jgi:hypothetical protein